MTHIPFVARCFVLLLAALAPACSSVQKTTCGPEVRAAYDIGSGSTKLKVAEVDTCRGKILKVLLEDQRKVDYRDDLAKGDGQNFSDKIQVEGETALRELQAKSELYSPKKHIGVATQAFRTALNAPAFAKGLSSRRGFSIRIISQEEEADLAFAAATIALVSTGDRGTIAVWDIGGGSQQLTVARLEGREFKKSPALKNEWGAVAFKNQVIKEVLKRNPATRPSPNPMTKAQLRKATSLSEKLAQSWPAENVKSAAVIGVGGVLTLSLPKRLGDEGPITQMKIEQALMTSAGLRDNDLKSQFADTELTNLALVLGFMKRLGIREYQPSTAQLTDALLTER